MNEREQTDENARNGLWTLLRLKGDGSDETSYTLIGAFKTKSAMVKEYRKQRALHEELPSSLYRQREPLKELSIDLVERGSLRVKAVFDTANIHVTFKQKTMDIIDPNNPVSTAQFGLNFQGIAKLLSGWTDEDCYRLLVAAREHRKARSGKKGRK